MYISDLSHSNPVLEDKLQRLYTLNRNTAIDMGVRAPYVSLLEALGNPHKNIPPVIHVAGTNGKGSTIAFMRAFLEAAGYRVHVYTSPHLVRFNERIRLAGDLISDEDLETLIDEVLEANQGGEVTFFEVTTAMAFSAFSRTPADVVLLETGLGGRLDCTNVIDAPLATVITSIGLDHTEFLGETLGDIAVEKLGIMKRDEPCVMGVGFDIKLFNSLVNNNKISKRSGLFRYGSEWSFGANSGHLVVSVSGDNVRAPLPVLAGAHQCQNAALAVATLKVVEQSDAQVGTREKAQGGILAVPDDAFSVGMRCVEWPGRLQSIELPDGTEGAEYCDFWLDGGHNEQASQALAGQVSTWAEHDDRPFHIIAGMMKHKDPAAFLAPLLPFSESLYAVSIPGERAAFTPEELLACLKERPETLAGVFVECRNDFMEALRDISRKSREEGKKSRVLIVGSLYLAGHVLKTMREQGHT